MKQLIITATSNEIGKAGPEPDPGKIYETSFMLSGIGIHATVYTLTRYLIEHPVDRVIQLGIAGSFHASLPLGSVVEVNKDCFADLAIDDHGRLIPAPEAGFISSNDETFTEGWLVSDSRLDIDLRSATGITVNTVSGSRDRVNLLTSIYHPDIESMEGAAAAYVCKKLGIPFFQIRAISNLVGPRDKSTWDIPLALNKLHQWLNLYLNQQPVTSNQ